WLTLLAVVGLALVSSPSSSAQREEIDFAKAKQIQQRRNQGEKISDEDRAYLEKAKAAFAKKQPEAANQAVGPPRESTGLIPLPDMTSEQRYHGQDGGLYGGGSNIPPEHQLDAALKAARQVQPLDAEGKPSPNGKIVFISQGMSNTTQEFQAFL